MAEEAVEEMFRALPAPSDFSTGQAARAALVSHLVGATPGSREEPWGLPRPAFLEVFFPGYAPGFYDAAVAAAFSGFSWADLAAAALCDAMYNLTTQLRKYLVAGKIGQSLATLNATLNSSAVAWYGEVFSGVFPPFASAFSRVPPSMRANAASEYGALLTSPAWVTMKREQYESGEWADAAWELFHHWLKLSVLGTPDPGIEQAIAKAVEEGLPVPENVGAGAWRTYMQWMAPGVTSVALAGHDVEAAAAKAILETTPFPSPEGTIWEEEGNSFNFTGPGQPGDGYRETHSGSCFSGATKVALADGSRARIDTVRAGDVVATPRGARRVALVAKPSRAGRSLHAIDGMGFRFTSAHPFVHAGDEAHPSIAAVEPSRLVANVATAADGGIARLGAGTRLTAFADGEAGEHTVRSVASETPAEGTDETLYDLILEDFGCYLAGDSERLFAVGSEVPDPLAAEYALLVIEGALRTAAPAIRSALNGVAPDDLPVLLEQPTRRLSSTLLRDALRALDFERIETEGASLAVSERYDPTELAASLATQFTSTEGAYDAALGRVFEWLSGRHGDELRAAVELGWRRVGSDNGDGRSVLAVSLLDARADPPAAFPAGGPSLSVSLDADERGVDTASRRPTGAFATPIDVVIYFEDWEPRPEPPWTSLRLAATTGPTEETIAGQLPLPPGIANFHRRFQVQLKDSDHQERGRISLDLRLLTPAEADREQTAATHWTDATRSRFAESLGQAIGTSIAHGLAREIERSPLRSAR